jgi:hypothetical protein
MPWRRLIVLGIVSASCVSLRDSGTSHILEAYGKLPLSFEENQGQSEGRVRYLSRGNGYSLFLTSSEAVLALRRGRPATREDAHRAEGSTKTRASSTAAVRMRLVGGRAEPEVSGIEKLAGRSHYFVGSDPSRWRRDIPHYARVLYRDIYPGVDLVYYGSQGRLEYDFLVSPGADPRRIRLRFEGADGMGLDEQGRLHLQFGEGTLEQHAPVVYQDVGGERRSVAGSYVLYHGGEVGFDVGAYDETRPIVIDPVLEYSTYLGGGSSADIGESVAVDGTGSVYVTGETQSGDFPTVNPYQTDQGDSDVFVTKLSPSGSSLVYSTYLGGSSGDYSREVVVDGTGNAYVTGETSSPDFPTLNPYQSHQGQTDAFVTKLAPSGSSLIYSTYLGGSGPDNGEGLAVDGTGSAYVTGKTYSTDFPTLNPYQTDQGGSDAFVTKLSPSGSSLVYSTYLGGSGDESARDVAADSSGNAYVTGESDSSDFPTVNPYQTDQGGRDLFVTKLSPSGSSLVYSTYLGGSSTEISGEGFALDGAGSVYVTGWTFSTDFPTVNPYQTDQGGVDAFVTKLSPSGSSLVYSTYLGGSSHENGWAIAVDDSGSAYVTGATLSTDFPTLNPFQADQPDWDVFVTKLSPSGTSLVYSTYLGGGRQEAAYGLAVDGSGNAYVTGKTESADFPTFNAYQASLFGAGDAFVAKLAATSTPSRFYTLAPCRAVDTRLAAGPSGGPALVCSSSPSPRAFAFGGICGIPATARAISYNVTVTQPTAAGHLRLFAAASSTPSVSSINYAAGATRGNNGIVRLGSGGLNVTCHQGVGTAHVIIDVNGYFE